MGILKSFQKPAQSIAEMMRKLTFNTRLVFDYFKIQSPGHPPIENKFAVVGYMCGPFKIPSW